MRIDCHVHTGYEKGYTGCSDVSAEKFLSSMKKAGIDGAMTFSVDPMVTRDWTPEQRMDDTLDFCRDHDTLYPFYWINPLEDSALEQVDTAVKKGFIGFKMICSEYNVGCTKSMETLERIASYKKPVLFHSGICWDGVNSANNHRPANFEALIEIPGIRFALAHVSWPWYDECIAVYGKFNNAFHLRPETTGEMFVDVTPGTPRVYREEVFRHLLCSDYELRYNLMFGTDCAVANYNAGWAQEWQDRDNALYEKFIPEDVEDFKEHVYYKNVMRFMGLSDEVVVPKIPMVAE